MKQAVESRYFGEGRSAVVSPLNKELLNADLENFRPTDFLTGGYGICMMSTMGKAAEMNGFAFSEARTKISFEPLADMSRLGSVDIKCFIKSGRYSAEEKSILENAATTMCPIGNSLNPEVKRTYEFIYGTE